MSYPQPNDRIVYVPACLRCGWESDEGFHSIEDAYGWVMECRECNSDEIEVKKE